MTDTLTAADPGPAVEGAAGCGCCQPRPPQDVAERIRDLQARRALVERCLAGLRSGDRP
jgi:hypothetical protein